MKTRITLLMVVTTAILLLESFSMPGGDSTKTEEYIIVGWNDLGMHCANKDFSKMAVLPPYNNLKSQIIKRGTASTLPEVVTIGYSVTYEIPGNTYSVGKTNFWNYEFLLFGVNLPDNIGLTGVGLSGNMVAVDNHFGVEGVPITPFTDNNLVTEDPYQLALLKAYDAQNNLLASTQPVIPVSNEINCVSSGCHSSETNILDQHTDEGGFDPNNTPILCASCHSSNALGTPGQPGLASFSEVIHEKHTDKTNDCYKCHPGPNTQCHRDVMHVAGMVCQDCHGTLEQVAQSIQEGREPWLEEPSCGSTSCHGANFAEEPGKLYRNSKGHGGLYCSTCHGSPHAILPTVNARDNVQNIALQGFEGTLRRCELCHGVVPTGPGPHGLMPPAPITKTDFKIFLEGPFNGAQMNNTLATSSQLPLSQPYIGQPWNYSGLENVSALPSQNIVDWVLIELRETNGDATTATQDKIIAERAGFLMTDGTIRDLNGSNLLEFPVPSYTNLFAVVRQRNHLGVMSAIPLPKINDYYAYDFSTSSNQVVGGVSGYNLLSGGIYGMVSGDGDANGVIEIADKLNVWREQAGLSGYRSGDFNLNGQVANKDKNSFWSPNLGKASMIP